MHIERFTTPDGQVRYRLLLPGLHSAYDGEQVVLTPQEMLDLMDYGLRYARALKSEVEAEQEEKSYKHT